MMTDADRIGVRAYAWSEADRAQILRHFIDLMFALDVAVRLLRDTAYNVHMKHRIDHMQATLEAVPQGPGGNDV